MITPSTFPQRAELIDGFEIPRIVTGLWQVADMEHDGQSLNIDAAAATLAVYADAGFDAFDVADHYGSAERIAGRFLQNFSVDVSLGGGRTVHLLPGKRCESAGLRRSLSVVDRCAASRRGAAEILSQGVAFEENARRPRRPSWCCRTLAVAKRLQFRDCFPKPYK